MRRDLIDGNTRFDRWKEVRTEDARAQLAASQAEQERVNNRFGGLLAEISAHRTLRRAGLSVRREREAAIRAAESIVSGAYREIDN